MFENDKILVKKILRGNELAKNELYDRHEQYWFRLCLRYASNRIEAQDIFQSGVLKIYKVLKSFDSEKGSFQSWSNKVLVNDILKYIQKQQWQSTFIDIDEVFEIEDLTENIIEKITAKELIEIIQELPTGYKLVFNLYELEGYTHKEISEKLNITIGTSKSQLSKAKKKLQQKIKILFQK